MFATTVVRPRKCSFPSPGKQRNSLYKCVLIRSASTSRNVLNEGFVLGALILGIMARRYTGPSRIELRPDSIPNYRNVGHIENSEPFFVRRLRRSLWELGVPEKGVRSRITWTSIFGTRPRTATKLIFTEPYSWVSFGNSTSGERHTSLGDKTPKLLLILQQEQKGM